MSGHAPETAEVAIVARTTGTREVQALQSELGKLNLSTVELNRQQQRFVQSTTRQAEAFGKTKAEIAALKAEQLGLGRQLAPVISKWREAEIAGTRAFGRVGHAAREAEHGIQGFLQHGGVMRELIVLFHESVIMGNYSRFGGSMMVLAERANVAHYIFTGLAAGIGAAAGALVTFGAAMVEGERESLAFGRALQQTGGFAGITEGQFNSMAQTIGREIPGSIGSAREALLALMRTGAFSDEALMSVTRAAVLFGEVTGEKSAKVVTDFAKMDMGVAKWAAHANRSYHFLSLAQFDYISQLEQQGQKEKAEQVTADALYHSLGNNAPKNLGYLIEAWYGVRDAVASAWDEMKNIGRAETLAERISNVQHQISGLQPSHLSLLTGSSVSNSPARQRLEQQLHRLQAEQMVQRTMAAAKSHRDQVQERGIAATQYLHHFRQSMLKGPDLARQNVAELRRQMNAALTANPNDPNALYIRSHWSQSVGFIDQRYDPAATKAQHAHESARKKREAADKRFNTLLREEAANLKSAQAALKAEQSGVTGSATAHKILNEQLRLEAWARKEIARYPDRARAIRAFVAKQEAMMPTQGGGTPGQSAFAAGTQAELTRFIASTKDVARQVEGIWREMTDGMTSALTDALTGQKFSMRNFAHGLFADMTNMVVKDGIMGPMMAGLGHAMGLHVPNASAAGFLASLIGGGGGLAGAVGGDVGKAMAGSAAIKAGGASWLGDLAKAIGFETGGIMTSAGPLPLNRYAGGGIANSPQVAMFGEGRMPEAYVPLPDGRSIPVHMRGGGGGGHTFNLHTTINHNGQQGFDPQQAAAEMHRQFIHMTQREIIRQKRDGGLLATNGTALA